MSQPPILAYEGLSLQQGSGWLFTDIDLYVGQRDRLALCRGRAHVPVVPGYDEILHVRAFPSSLPCAL